MEDNFNDYEDEDEDEELVSLDKNGDGEEDLDDFGLTESRLSQMIFSFL